MSFNSILSIAKDEIIWYTYDKPRDIYKTIKHWFYCNWNVYHWRLVKAAFLAHPWDYGFGLNIEELMIDKQLHWFKHHQIMCDEQYEQILRTLKLAKYCIHIMNNDTDLYHFTGEVTWKEPESIDVCDTIATSEADTSTLNYHYDGPYLNWNNAKRFLNDYQINHFQNNQHEYYLIKVKHLYYKLREQYTEYWWD